MKRKFKMKRLVTVFTSFLLFAFSIFSCTPPKERKVLLSEDDLLVLTQRAFLEGYKAALLKQDEDTIWANLSSEYRVIFKY